MYDGVYQNVKNNQKQNGLVSKVTLKHNNNMYVVINF